MADAEDLVALILSSLEAVSGGELCDLSELLASDSSVQLQRLWLLLASPSRSLSIISFLDTLSHHHRCLLLSRVTLRLVCRITEFLESLAADEGAPQSASANSLETNMAFHTPVHTEGDTGDVPARCLSGEICSQTGLDNENGVDAKVFGVVLEDVESLTSAERVSTMDREVWNFSANARLPGLADSGVAMNASPSTIDVANLGAHMRIAPIEASDFEAMHVGVVNSHTHAYASPSNPRFMGMGLCTDMPNTSREDEMSIPWCETDAAFLFLFLWETQEQECQEAMQRWCIDPFITQLLMVQDMAVLIDDEWKAGLTRAPRWRERLQQYLLQNILQVGYGFPCMASTNIPASLSAYIDTIGRFQRIMRSMKIEDGCDQMLPPTSAAILHSLPTSIIGLSSEEKGKVCIICKEELEPSSVASQLPCLHVYHWDCILPWLKQRSNCPICRHELPTDDLDYELHKKIQILKARVS